jgi:hypothetical protein
MPAKAAAVAASVTDVLHRGQAASGIAIQRTKEKVLQGERYMEKGCPKVSWGHAGGNVMPSANDHWRSALCLAHLPGTLQGRKEVGPGRSHTSSPLPPPPH